MPKDKELTEEEKEKLLKKNIRDKLKEVLKGLELDEQFTVSLRTKQQKDYILDYPDRTICGCDGEVYNTLMNWAYAQQIPNHLAFDRFVETFVRVSIRSNNVLRGLIEHLGGITRVRGRNLSVQILSFRYFQSQSLRLYPLKSKHPNTVCLKELLVDCGDGCFNSSAIPKDRNPVIQTIPDC